jgi:lipoate-protein ligase B
MSFHDAWQRQEAAYAEVFDRGEERVFLVEHPPTLTLGRRAAVSRSHVLASDAELRRMHVDVVETDRGGDVTYHGPGQIVAYPIIRLADHGLSVGRYMRLLQTAVIDCLKRFRLEASLDPQAPGVWVPDPHLDGTSAKVCAVGVRVRRGVTLHGLALNVEPDLMHFGLIDACGLGRPVTSLHRVMGSRAPSTSAIKPILVQSLRDRLAGLANAGSEPIKQG